MSAVEFVEDDADTIVGGGIPGDISPVGLELREGLSFVEWQRAGTILSQWYNSLPFIIGDWLVYGSRFGEEAFQAIDGPSPDTVRGWEYTCSRIEPQRRHEVLSFGHHRAVASLDPKEQDELLAIAEKDGWRRTQLREEVRRRKDERERLKAEADRVEIIPPAPPSGLVKRESGDSISIVPLDLADQHELGTTDIPPRPFVGPGPIDVTPPAVPTHATDEHANHLYSVARTTSSAALSVPVLAILGERTLLLRVMQAARRAISVGAITADLEAAMVAFQGEATGITCRTRDGVCRYSACESRGTCLAGGG